MDFFTWLDQSGENLVYFAGIIIAAGAIIKAIIKAYHVWIDPVHETRKQSEEADKELHDRIDTLETRRAECDEKFANDFEQLNSLRREQNRQAEAISMLTEGTFLIIQHLVTDDHVEDMQEWMRDYTKQTVKSDIKS